MRGAALPSPPIADVPGPRGPAGTWRCTRARGAALPLPPRPWPKGPHAPASPPVRLRSGAGRNPRWGSGGLSPFRGSTAAENGGASETRTRRRASSPLCPPGAPSGRRRCAPHHSSSRAGPAGPVRGAPESRGGKAGREVEEAGPGLRGTTQVPLSWAPGAPPRSDPLPPADPERRSPRGVRVARTQHDGLAPAAPRGGALRFSDPALGARGRGLRPPSLAGRRPRPCRPFLAPFLGQARPVPSASCGLGLGPEGCQSDRAPLPGLVPLPGERLWFPQSRAAPGGSSSSSSSARPGPTFPPRSVAPGRAAAPSPAGGHWPARAARFGPLCRGALSVLLWRAGGVDRER